MIENYLNMQGRRGPIGFLISFIVFAVLGVALYEAAERGLQFNPHFSSLAIFLGILAGMLCYSIILTQAVRRTRDMGRAGILAALSALPAANIPLYLTYQGKLFQGGMIVLPVLGFIGLMVLMLPTHRRQS